MLPSTTGLKKCKLFAALLNIKKPRRIARGQKALSITSLLLLRLHVANRQAKGCKRQRQAEELRDEDRGNRGIDRRAPVHLRSRAERHREGGVAAGHAQRLGPSLRALPPTARATRSSTTPIVIPIAISSPKAGTVKCHAARYRRSGASRSSSFSAGPRSLNDCRRKNAARGLTLGCSATLAPANSRTIVAA